MVQLEIAAKVVGRLLNEGGYLTARGIWPINKENIEAQGKAFAGQLATLIGAVASIAVEKDFFFEKDVIFSEKTFQSLGSGEPLRFSTRELLTMARRMLGGVLAGKLSIATIRTLLKGMKNGSRGSAVHDYPADETGYDVWAARAENSGELRQYGGERGEMEY